MSIWPDIPNLYETYGELGHHCESIDVTPVGRFGYTIDVRLIIVPSPEMVTATEPSAIRRHLYDRSEQAIAQPVPEWTVHEPSIEIATRHGYIQCELRQTLIWTGVKQK